MMPREEMSPKSRSGHSISIKGVSKRYSRKSDFAVQDVTLDIEPGEFMTFLGPSGSGKTTMLSLIAGLTSLDTGSIVIEGKDVSRLKSHRRDLGVVFQQYALFPHMTVAQNVAYPLRRRKTKGAELDQALDHILEVVQLAEFSHRYPRELSGGQQQRVALARAVVYEPKALLLDEPLSALDKRLREQLQSEIESIHRRLGLTFIFVTHDQQEAMTLSDRIAVFNRGQIQQVGRPEELYARPESRFVANFLGDSNMFEGRRVDNKFQWLSHEFELSDADARISVGDCSLMVRPERLGHAVDRNDVPAGANWARGVVESAAFIGDRRRAVVRMDGGVRGVLVVSNNEELKAGVGGEVYIYWDRNDQVIVND